MKCVMLNRNNKNPVDTTDKEGTTIELILLCCALLFLFNLFFSNFWENTTSLSTFNLQVVSTNSLALFENSDRKLEQQEIPAALTPFFFEPIPINYCDKELLMSVSGIGPALADSIIETRKRVGMFKNKYDLLQVSGIGESRMRRFAPSFNFSSK